MDINELRGKHPDLFDREYQKWAAHDMGYDWWDGVYDQLRLECEPKGVHIDLERTYFQLSYSQGDHAEIGGFIDFAAWMEANGYDKQYQPLYLDAKEYGANMTIGRRWVSMDYAPGDTYPQGVFSDLPEDAWDELVEEQYKAEDWENLLDETVKDLNHDLYKRLVEEYEYLTSEESFVEYCIANDVTFDEGDDE
jgi:hypothetical protein